MNILDYKVILISPKDKKNHLLDGQITLLGDKESGAFHSDAMIDYGAETYGDDSVFGIFKGQYYMPVYPAYCFVEYLDTIVFLNISNKYEKLGVLYLPSYLSGSQIDSLNSLARHLKGFEIEINKDLVLFEGMVESNQKCVVCDGSDIIRSRSYQKKKA